jgi:transglutaminase-like putative cysteine protease
MNGHDKPGVTSPENTRGVAPSSPTPGQPASGAASPTAARAEARPDARPGFAARARLQHWQPQEQPQPASGADGTGGLAPGQVERRRTFYDVIHETRHHYQRTVTLSQQSLHMTPRFFERQDVLAHQIDIDPAPQDWVMRTDYFGNTFRNMTLATPHRELVVRAASTVALHARLDEQGIAGSMAWEAMRENLRVSAGAPSLDPFPFLFESPHVVRSDALAAYALQSFTPGRPTLEAAHDLTERIYRDFEFDPEATTISTPLEEVLTGRRGVCQDFAHLMIGCLRAIGLAARYVSGYILTMPPPGKPRLVGADASHAWVSVYCTGYGWVDFDPTNRRLVKDEHITLGWGRDFSDVTPMRGMVLGGGAQDLDVSVTVTPLPR